MHIVDHIGNTDVKAVDKLVQGNVSVVTVHVDSLKVTSSVLELGTDPCFTFLIVSDFQSKSRSVKSYIEIVIQLDSFKRRETRNLRSPFKLGLLSEA